MIFDVCLIERGNRIHWVEAFTTFDFGMAIEVNICLREILG